jgi:hypothetical protein
MTPEDLELINKVLPEYIEKYTKEIEDANCENILLEVISKFHEKDYNKKINSVTQNIANLIRSIPEEDKKRAYFRLFKVIQKSEDEIKIEKEIKIIKFFKESEDFKKIAILNKNIKSSFFKDEAFVLKTTEEFLEKIVEFIELHAHRPREEFPIIALILSKEK